uniref:Uncharacterized protein n=1 Tax=Arundo donax TaxID=35708 RepID=A0A0A9HES1_ARUDO
MFSCKASSWIYTLMNQLS